MFELLNAFGECSHAMFIKPAIDAISPAADKRKGFAHTMDAVFGTGSGGGRKPQVPSTQPV